MKTKIYRLTSREKTRVMELLTSELNRRVEIVFAYAYGSFAEDDDLPVHDIDIGVYVRAMRKEEATPYSLELESVLSKVCRIPTHVCVVNHAPVPFLYQVIRGKIVFSRDEELRTRLTEQAIGRYLDIKPLLLRGLKEAFAA